MPTTEPCSPAATPRPLRAGPPRWTSRPVSAQPRYGWVFTAGGVLVFLAASAAAGGAALLAAFGTSYCGEGPTASQVHELHHALTVITVLWAAVPAAIGLVAHLQRRRPEVWCCVASVCAVAGLIAAPSAQPSSWCF